MAQSPATASAYPLCSICLDEISATCGRTVVTLQCSHKFHLDCIGSAFNVSGIMQCPNCRHIENGEWRRFENDGPESYIQGLNLEGQQEVIQMVNHGEHWCPYHGRVIALPAVAHQDVPTFFATNHHQPASSLVTEVFHSSISRNHPNQVHAPLIPVCDHVIASNQAPVAAHTLGALQGYAGGLPHNHAINHRTVAQPGNRYDRMQGMPPAGYVSAPVPLHHMRRFYHVPALNLNMQNNHTHHAIHGGHVLNSAIHNNLQNAPVHYFPSPVDEANHFQFFDQVPDDTDLYWDQRD